MSEETKDSLIRMSKAIGRLPRREAERIVYDAANRAEAVADYIESQKEAQHE